MEDIDDFYSRIYVNCNTYPEEPFALVWKSRQQKEDLGKYFKPEKWDIPTVKNYLRYLKTGDT